MRRTCIASPATFSSEFPDAAEEKKICYLLTFDFAFFFCYEAYTAGKKIEVGAPPGLSLSRLKSQLCPCVLSTCFTKGSPYLRAKLKNVQFDVQRCR